MGQLGKQRKVNPITLEFTVFPFTNFTVALVGANIEKCDMQFVTETCSPPYL